jgi:hypothetical protein
VRSQGDPLMTPPLKCCLPVLLVSLLVLASSARTDACPFCNMEGKTLTGEVRDATMVLYGSIGKGSETNETTPFKIESVVKKPENPKLLGDGKEITLNRFLPDDKGQFRYLIFCDEFKGRIDPYYGVAVKPDSDIAKYITKALELRDAPAAKRLRFFFDYLDNPDVEVSNDALKEFGKADYKDYKDMAKALPPDKIAGWLKDKNTQPFRYGLYASLLGHCGKAEHAKLLREMLDDKDKVQGAGVDGIMAAYTMLDPKEGWQFIASQMKDSSKHFMVRYSALKAARFIHDYRPDLAKGKDLAEAVASQMEQKDLGDMAIEDLRKWKCWDMADRVLALRQTEAFKEVPIIRRAVLRFALDCKDNSGCAAYVEEMRKKDPEEVRDQEELLQLQRQ